MLSFADNLVQNRAVYAPIRFEEIVIIIVMINKIKKKNNDRSTCINSPTSSKI